MLDPMNDRVSQFQRLMCRIALFVLATLIVPATTMAQYIATAPPAPTIRKSPAAWIGYGLLFVLLVAVMVVSLMPSKRGHQD